MILEVVLTLRELFSSPWLQECHRTRKTNPPPITAQLGATPPSLPNGPPLLTQVGRTGHPMDIFLLSGPSGPAFRWPGRNVSCTFGARGGTFFSPELRTLAIVHLLGCYLKAVRGFRIALFLRVARFLGLQL